MKTLLLCSLSFSMSMLVVCIHQDVAVAQVPPGLKARYTVERVIIPQPGLQDISSVHDFRVNLTDPANPYAVVVGSFTRFDNVGAIGFIYDHFGTIDAAQPKRFYSLDELPGATYPPAWAGARFTSSKCFGLNSSGLITGYLRDPETNERLAFYVDISEPSLELKEIPRPGGRDATDHWLAGRRVTEAGDILVRYIDSLDGRNNQFIFDSVNGSSQPITVRFIDPPFVNSLGDLVGRTYEEPNYFIKRYNYFTGITDDVPNDSLSVQALNDIGQFVGVRRVTDRRGRNKHENGDYVTRFGNNLQIEWDTRASHVYSLNLAGDSIFDRSSTSADPLPSDAFVYMDEWGELNLMDLVPDADPQSGNDSSDILASAQLLVHPRLSDRDSTGLGWIACVGMASGADYQQELFILIPSIPEETPGISIDSVDGLTTTEDGGTDVFHVVLDSEPTSDVTIGLSISADGADEGTIDKTILTFTTEDWSIAQSVTITGLDDDQVDGDVTYAIITTPAMSDDPAYDGLDATDVSVTNVDNDGQSGGGSETYSSGMINEEIGDNTSTSFELVAASHQITNLTVNVNITHPRPDDLLVYLIGPEGGDPVRLLNLTGDNPVANFNESNSLGVWTLEIHDIEAGPGSRRRPKTGTLNSWSIRVDY